MVMVLEQKLVQEIARIGRLRAPNEACGLMLPTEVNGVQVIELPNRAKKPLNDFVMTGSDMILALEQVFRGDFSEDLIPSLTAWHTHPRGNVGPSKEDMHHKPAHIKSLVVTIHPDGKPPQATWF